jgi:D-alanine-D-alanine ligase
LASGLLYLPLPQHERGKETTMRVAVLMGGWGEEREISLKTGEAVARALASKGHDVVRIDAAKGLDVQLRDAQVDACFLALHGRMGEDGKVQGLLEVMGIPYTGSGVMASALAMNKPFAKRLFRAANLATAIGYSVRREQLGRAEELHVDLGFPCVVKPALGGSSVGLSLVRSEQELAPALAFACRFGGEALVERFVKGREVTVAIVGGEVLGSLEVAHQGMFDFETKYNSGTARYHLPPRLGPTRVQNVEAMALKAYEALGCRGYARVDFICSESGQANDVLLEVNTLPGMTATSLLPKIAAAAGLDFPALCERILSLAAMDEVEASPSSAAVAAA